MAVLAWPQCTCFTRATPGFDAEALGIPGLDKLSRFVRHSAINPQSPVINDSRPHRPVMALSSQVAAILETFDLTYHGTQSDQ